MPTGRRRAATRRTTWAIWPPVRRWTWRGPPISAPAAAIGGRSWRSRSSPTARSTRWIPTPSSPRSTCATAAVSGASTPRIRDADSTNIGGGLGVDQGTLYAVNGLARAGRAGCREGHAEMASVDIGRAGALGADHRRRAASSSPRSRTSCWRWRRAMAAQLWTHQAANATTTMLGQPAPAYADGLVVAGLRLGRAGRAARR